MADSSVEQELLGLERRFWQAMQDQDVDAAVALTADPCVLTGAQGVSRIEPSVFAAMMSGAPYTMDGFEIGDDIQFLQLSDDSAIVAYRVHEELTVEGQPVSFDAADASVWVRRDGRWLCALHTESILGDPFGRQGR
jgi:ketosteroid isomerase-like protein